MKPVLVYKVIALGGNFFYASFFNMNMNKGTSCYMMDDSNTKTSMLIPIIDNAVLVGCGNNSYDDILMNYIRYHGVINTKELYSLSEEILHKKKFDEDLSRDPDIEFYMHRSVVSVDMNTLSFFEKTKEIPFDYDARKHVLQDDLTKIFSWVGECIENNKSVLNRLEMALNYGYRKKWSELPSKEATEKRYVELMLGL